MPRAKDTHRNQALSELADYGLVKLLGRILKDSQALFNGQHDNHHQTLYPCCDLRETADHYFDDSGFPGIASRSAQKLQWLDCRTL
jgi:hypothetical protein